MAQNLQLLKRRIRTAKNISQIAKAMEMMSASKIKRAQLAVQSYQPYAQKITDITYGILNKVDREELSHPFLQSNKSKKKLLIILSPDKGLAGSLITNLFKKALEVDSKNYLLITVGKRSELFVGKLEAELTASFPFGTNLPDYSRVYELSRLIETLYKEGRIAGVDILYAEFNSLFLQTPVLKQLLPLQATPDMQASDAVDYAFEPPITEVLEDMLSLYFEVMLFNAIIQAYTSEQAARMIAMQNAKNNAFDIAEYLTLSYNKLRQEKITSEILDLANNQ